MLLHTVQKKTSAIAIALLFILGLITSCAHEHPTGMRKADEEKERPATIEKPEEEKEHPEEGQAKPRTEAKPEHPAEETGAAEEVTLEDIASVAEEYVQENSEDGIFRFYDEKTDTWLDLKLAKIHRDKLAQTEDDEYFVCADFQGMDGNMYDLDFFVLGETKDELEVNEDSISIHKVNGKERYTWNYNKDEDAWVKQPVSGEEEHPQPPEKEHP